MFNIDYISLFHNLPPELAVLFISMLPIAELRLAIPIAIRAYGMPVLSAYFWSVVGNLIPAFFLLLFLEPVARWLMAKSEFFNRFFNWIFIRTRKKFSSQAAKYGKYLGLVLFVAIPLPVTGAWTGAVAAFLFGIPFRRSFSAIAIGVLIAGVVVILVTKGIGVFF